MSVLHRNPTYIRLTLEGLKHHIKELQDIAAENMDKGSDEISQLASIAEVITDMYLVEVSPGIFMTHELFETMKNDGI